MDVAYDHIQEETLTDDNQASSSLDKTPAQPPTLNAEFQDAYRAFSNSPWGARIGGFLGNVVKQGESVYREAEKELSAVSQDATRGFSDLRTTLISRTRALSIATTQAAASAAAAASSGVAAASSSSSTTSKDEQTTPTTAKDLSAEASLKQQQEDDSVLARLRGEAAKRLKDLQKAEDAADEALLRFGSNLRDFLKDAIKIAPPSEEEAAKRTEEGRNNNGVLFESKDAQGKRVIHTSRFDAQLHVIHTTPESFKEPASGQEYDAWVKEFDVDKKTEAIATDLDKYPELRATMEKLVPDQVPYADFWKRYYFLRHGIETAEARRRDLLKAASAEEEVGWDEDSSDEEDSSEEETSGDDKAAPATTKKPAARSSSTESSTTIHPPSTAAAAQGSLKPSEPRKSNDEKSQADSEASYDVVGAASGVPSRAPNSPKEGRKADESSDEEDWE
ncbi:hypothetical protein N0V85_000987 [Neurospora sp. IMI 360204]|nr:hypothetical protein N0V85_000987 [Neurospora sp. IMI 360204]